MALRDCPECRQPISSAAGTCPHCGHPLQPRPARRGVRRELLLVLAIVAVFALLYGQEDPDKKTQTTATRCDTITGLRWSEQFKLTRDQVHLDEGFIELRTTKAGRPQARMLNARAVELLRAQLARHTTPWVYPNVGQYGPIDQSYFTRYIWIPARKEAGVGNARWNDWRHTFASDLTMAGHSDRTVATLLGHTSTQMVARYAHLADAHLRQAVESLTPTGGHPGQKLANSPSTKPKKPRK